MAVLGVGVTGVEGWWGRVAVAGVDGGNSRSGDARDDGVPIGLGPLEEKGVLAFLLAPKMEREEDDWGNSGGCSEVGLVAVGEP